MLKRWFDGFLRKFSPWTIPSGFMIDDVTAYQILDCTDSNFMKRYKELMKINHPDFGGSNYIASVISSAKEYIKAKNQPI